MIKYLLLLTCIFAATTKANLTLVENGKSDYVIVCNSAPMAAYADLRGARTLQTYIAQMTGAMLPIVQPVGPVPDHAIIVGVNADTDALGIHLDAAQLGDEGFIIKTIGNRLVLAGPGPRGSMAACNTFLDHLGVRWFTAKVTRDSSTLPPPSMSPTWMKRKSPASNTASLISPRPSNPTGPPIIF